MAEVVITRQTANQQVSQPASRSPRRVCTIDGGLAGLSYTDDDLHNAECVTTNYIRFLIRCTKYKLTYGRGRRNGILHRLELTSSHYSLTRVRPISQRIKQSVIGWRNSDQSDGTMHCQRQGAVIWILDLMYTYVYA